MNLQNYQNMTQKALEEGSFVPLFRGDLGYATETGNYAVADIPTDWSIIIQYGIFALYEEQKDPRIPKLCRKSLLIMMEGDYFDVWCAYSLCFSLAYHDFKKDAPFSILDEILLRTLQGALCREEEVLMQSKCWQGKNLKNGLWSDIFASARIAVQKYGVKFLKYPDFRFLLKEKLDVYAQDSKAVRRKNMDYPPMNVAYGMYGKWKPMPALHTPTLEELEAYYGVLVSEELYQYISCWRFAGLELHFGRYDCNIWPLSENSDGQPNYLLGIELARELFFVLGTAIDQSGLTTYSILLRNSGGIYLLEDGTKRPVYLTSGIYKFLIGSEV